MNRSVVYACDLKEIIIAHHNTLTGKTINAALNLHSHSPRQKEKLSQQKGIYSHEL